MQGDLSTTEVGTMGATVCANGVFLRKIRVNDHVLDWKVLVQAFYFRLALLLRSKMTQQE